ncbi:MAG: type II restriction endonuclease [Deltaproteobacteria bacterium]|jgi:type II restriction enzyme|nr:type II restriction endonuclease [Deltaproteobacteria bacterium]
MKQNPSFQKILNCKTSDDVFECLVSNLKQTIKSWDYFVNWSKVIKNYRDIETRLNILNTLIGKSDIKKEAKELLNKYPEIMPIVPDLLAYRDRQVNILSDFKTFGFESYDFSKPINVDKAVKFLDKSGFLKLLSDRNIKSIPDYFIGIGVGLDSNGRKNRSGTAMEDIIEFFVKDLCDRNGFEYITQATADKIKSKWDKTITVNKSSKRIDFAINTPGKLYLIETNFYDGGGSKLKSTAGEYIDSYNQWTNDGHQFIWITDGSGWKSTRGPLRDTFDVIDYILNIDMVQKGILENLIIEKDKV